MMILLLLPIQKMVLFFNARDILWLEEGVEYLYMQSLQYLNATSKR